MPPWFPAISETDEEIRVTTQPELAHSPSTQRLSTRYLLRPSPTKTTPIIPFNPAAFLDADEALFPSIFTRNRWPQQPTDDSLHCYLQELGKHHEKCDAECIPQSPSPNHVSYSSLFSFSHFSLSTHTPTWYLKKSVRCHGPLPPFTYPSPWIRKP